jgi:hypothetical protein
MELVIKNKTERIISGNFEYLKSLFDDVNSYIDIFKIGDKKIYDYTHVSYIFETYPIIQKFFPSKSDKLMKFICKISNYIMEEFKNLDKNDIDAINNFQSHRLKVVSTAGLVLKSKLYLDWSEIEIKNFIGKNLKEDGSCLDYSIRDSLTYVTYTLTPLLETCINLWKSNRPMYYFYIHPTAKSSISKSIQWLIPYINGKKSNIMFINSIYASDKNKKEYGKKWDKANALNLINLCINFDMTLIGLYSDN